MNTISVIGVDAFQVSWARSINLNGHYKKDVLNGTGVLRLMRTKEQPSLVKSYHNGLLHSMTYFWDNGFPRQTESFIHHGAGLSMESPFHGISYDFDKQGRLKYYVVYNNGDRIIKKVLDHSK